MRINNDNINPFYMYDYFEVCKLCLCGYSFYKQNEIEEWANNISYDLKGKRFFDKGFNTFWSNIFIAFIKEYYSYIDYSVVEESPRGFFYFMLKEDVDTAMAIVTDFKVTCEDSKRFEKLLTLSAKKN